MGRALLIPSKVPVSLFIGDQVVVAVEIHRAKAGSALKKFSTETARVINLGQGRCTYIFFCVLTENYLKAWDAALQETNA
jgi:hypothetical protein